MFHVSGPYQMFALVSCFTNNTFMLDFVQDTTRTLAWTKPGLFGAFSSSLRDPNIFLPAGGGKMYVKSNRKSKIYPNVIECKRKIIKCKTKRRD